MTSFAEYSGGTMPLRTKVSPTLKRHKSVKGETGFSLGTPSGINLVLGARGSSSFPCAIRISGMYLGSNIGWGAEAELAWLFDVEGGLTQSLGIGAARTQLTIGGPDKNSLRLQGVGPVYGLSWHGVTLNTGLLFGEEAEFRLSDNSQGRLSSPFLRLSLGYSVFW